MVGRIHDINLGVARIPKSARHPTRTSTRRLAVWRTVSTAAAVIGASAFALLASTSAQADIPASQRAVLLDIHASTNGADWIDVAPAWTGAAGTECGWGGVTCNASQTAVTAIELPRRNLTGSLPTSLNQLVSLRTLDLSGNRLSGTIPTLTGLVNLQSLHLSRNLLNGSIPSLSGLTALERFDVRTNLLTGGLPTLAGLDNLTAVIVANNLLSGPVPDVPTPNRLAAGASMLCPNNFTASPSAPWDAATAAAITWWRGCAYPWGLVPIPAAHGSIYPPTRQLTDYGGYVDFDIVPEAGYGVVVAGTCEPGSWLGDRYRVYRPDVVAIPPPFPVPGPDCTVEPVFSNARYNVLVTSAGDGTTTPEGVRNVLFGSMFTVDATAAAGRFVVYQSDCDRHTAPSFPQADPVRRSHQISRDCAVHVKYLPVFRVTASAGAYGHVNGPFDPVAQGYSTWLAVTPDPGYGISSVTGCGGALEAYVYADATQIYRTGAITADCAITARFAALADAAPHPVPADRSGATLLLLAIVVLVACTRICSGRSVTRKREADGSRT